MSAKACTHDPHLLVTPSGEKAIRMCWRCGGPRLVPHEPQPWDPSTDDLFYGWMYAGVAVAGLLGIALGIVIWVLA